MRRRFFPSLCLLLAMLAGGVPLQAEEFDRLRPEVEPGHRPDLSGTEGGIWMTFDDAEEKLKHSPNRVIDQRLDAYLKDVVCRLSPDFCPHVRVYVMRVPHFNASMAPNGMMQIWTGLLLRMRNEAQLAAVLGHEMGHFLRRHSLKRFEDMKTKSTLLTFQSLGLGAAAATGSLDPSVASTTSDVSHLLAYASLFAYSRDQEREADQYGVQLMSNTRLELSEAPRIWDNLLAEEAAAKNKKDRAPVFFASHPEPGERIDNIHQHVRAIRTNSETPTGELNADRYWDMVGPHMPTLLEDEINLHRFGRTEHLLGELVEQDRHPGLVKYYMGELFRLRNEEGDMNRARQYYLACMEHEDHPAVAHRSLGLLYYKSGNRAGAQQQFSEYLEMKPEAGDREMIEFYIASLSGSQ